MTPRFDIVIAAEDESDARRAKSLIDRLFLTDIDWLAEQPEHAQASLLDGFREWRGHDHESSFLDIHKVHALADARGLPSPRGHFDGRPAAPDYHSAVRALWLLLDGGLPRALVWIRDTDGQRSRITGWQHACVTAGAEFSVLIGGFPHECMEAWLLASCEADGRPALRELREQLGFDPAAQPERLSHKKNAPKSAKAVCDALAISDANWEGASLEDLLQRGVGCGLAAFVADVRDKLVAEARRSS